MVLPHRFVRPGDDRPARRPLSEPARVRRRRARPPLERPAPADRRRTPGAARPRGRFETARRVPPRGDRPIDRRPAGSGRRRARPAHGGQDAPPQLDLRQARRALQPGRQCPAGAAGRARRAVVRARRPARGRPHGHAQGRQGLHPARSVLPARTPAMHDRGRPPAGPAHEQNQPRPGRRTGRRRTGRVRPGHDSRHAPGG